ncbi:MAG: DMT family transporter [Salinivirgaceae bacterium]|nr:DMT family transporter [Salinivirgaceae bacterium]
MVKLLLALKTFLKFDLSKKAWQWTVLFTLALVWGSSFILMKKGLRSFEFGQVAALRVFFGFLVLAPLFLRKIKKLNRKNIIHIIISGYAGIFFPAFLFAKAQTEINSSLAGMINSLAPFFALIFGVLLYKNKPGKYQVLGILLGLVGAIGLISDGNIFESFGTINGYALYVVLATFGYGINANQIRFKLRDFNGVEITILSFLFIGPPAGIYLLFSDFSMLTTSPTWAIDLSFIFMLSFLGSVIALFFFNSLVQYTSALFATSVTYIIPFFAIIWGVFDDEKITIVQVASIMIALFGVWLVNKKKKPKIETN